MRQLRNERRRMNVGVQSMARILTELVSNVGAQLFKGVGVREVRDLNNRHMYDQMMRSEIFGLKDAEVVR